MKITPEYRFKKTVDENGQDQFVEIFEVNNDMKIVEITERVQKELRRRIDNHCEVIETSGITQTFETTQNDVESEVQGIYPDSVDFQNELYIMTKNTETNQFRTHDLCAINIQVKVEYGSWKGNCRSGSFQNLNALHAEKHEELSRKVGSYVSGCTERRINGFLSLNNYGDHQWNEFRVAVKGKLGAKYFKFRISEDGTVHGMQEAFEKAINQVEKDYLKKEESRTSNIADAKFAFDNWVERKGKDNKELKKLKDAVKHATTFCTENMGLALVDKDIVINESRKTAQIIFEGDFFTVGFHIHLAGGIATPAQAVVDMTVGTFNRDSLFDRYKTTECTSRWNAKYEFSTSNIKDSFSCQVFENPELLTSAPPTGYGDMESLSQVKSLIEKFNHALLFNEAVS